MDYRKKKYDLLTPAEAGRILGVTAHQVRNLIRSGQLERAPLPGRSWLIERAALDRIAYRRKPRKSSGNPVPSDGGARKEG